MNENDLSERARLLVAQLRELAPSGLQFVRLLVAQLRELAPSGLQFVLVIVEETEQPPVALCSTLKRRPMANLLLTIGRELSMELDAEEQKGITDVVQG